MSEANPSTRRRDPTPDEVLASSERRQSIYRECLCEIETALGAADQPSRINTAEAVLEGENHDPIERSLRGSR